MTGRNGKWARWVLLAVLAVEAAVPLQRLLNRQSFSAAMARSST